MMLSKALLQVVEPGAIAAAVAAEADAANRRDQVGEALMRDLQAARYAADRAFRQYDSADPDNRLVAGELEARWNNALRHVAEVETKIAEHEMRSPPRLEKAPLSLATLANDLKVVWSAPTTDARLKKRIVRTVINEVLADIDADAAEIVLLIHWMWRRGQRNATSPDIVNAVRQLVLIAWRPHRVALAPDCRGQSSTCFG